MSHPSRPAAPGLARRLAGVLAALGLAATVAACGGDAKSPADGSPSPAGAGSFPVTVDHKYGSTTVKAEPKKVVTLGLSDQDAVLALGVRPVGSVDWFKEKPYGKWPWTKALWGSSLPQVVGERDDYTTEKIAALKPDLIIAQYSGMKKEQYETLSKIAPVVAQPKGHEDYLAPWPVMTEQTGKALGRQAKATELVAGIKAKFEAVRKKHPEWANLTIAVADSFEPGKFSAFTKDDPKAAFFADLGFRLSPNIDKLAQPGWNVAEFSAEKVDLLDVDRLVWVTSGKEHDDRIKAEPLYQKLKVVQGKKDIFVPYQDPDVGAAFSFNTVLSIPYAIEQMEPLLAGIK
ncbi:iron-siderophore ABC transporter substrate-binding protein [Longispora albida]|uniref:iron-siderophore ABC transporter substrate-binding protein n=1 Tax=Longispora albida TaxID=203523 RepID=UPI00036AFECB|nr:iron-siderophore ABC transporter substrate-binding protein [Longispora albida]